ncbi:MAG: adenylosuccinate lyase, partial [Cytophagales bacterium CG18_big_fil_WC_8_21_14_2_50_42_9]
MDLNTLTAISPVDGRYRAQLQELAPFFSEFGLIHYRVRVEIEYFISLCELPLPQLQEVKPEVYEQLRQIYTAFAPEDALA